MLLSTITTANALDPAPVTGRIWSAHNPEIFGHYAIASWYDDGVRVFDLVDPGLPVEIASWAGEDAPRSEPPTRIWGIAPIDEHAFAASDSFHGLYVLRMTP